MSPEDLEALLAASISPEEFDDAFVAALIITVKTYDNVDEAIAIGSGTDFGLIGSVFGDADRAFTVARRIRTGQVPYHGRGASSKARRLAASICGALGREGGPEAFEASLEAKTVISPSNR
jgi:acyl-CoA reductase-like NAD-dependent aldehyde dehydrogenase